MARKTLSLLFGLVAIAVADQATTNPYFTVQTTWPASYPTGGSSSTTDGGATEITSTPSIFESGHSVVTIRNTTVLSITPTLSASGSGTQSATTTAGTGAAGMIHPQFLAAVAGGAMAGWALVV